MWGVPACCTRTSERPCDSLSLFDAPQRSGVILKLPWRYFVGPFRWSGGGSSWLLRCSTISNAKIAGKSLNGNRGPFAVKISDRISRFVTYWLMKMVGTVLAVVFVFEVAFIIFENLFVISTIYWFTPVFFSHCPRTTMETKSPSLFRGSRPILRYLFAIGRFLAHDWQSRTLAYTSFSRCGQWNSHHIELYIRRSPRHPAMRA